MTIFVSYNFQHTKICLLWLFHYQTAAVVITPSNARSVSTLYLLVACVYKERSMRDWWKMCCVQFSGYSYSRHTMCFETTRENSLKHVVYDEIPLNAFKWVLIYFAMRIFALGKRMALMYLHSHWVENQPRFVWNANIFHSSVESRTQTHRRRWCRKST